MERSLWKEANGKEFMEGRQWKGADGKEGAKSSGTFTVPQHPSLLPTPTPCLREGGKKFRHFYRYAAPLPAAYAYPYLRVALAAYPKSLCR